MKQPVNLFWFRRDLRLTDNAGLSIALQSDKPLLLLFIFDRNILDKLEQKMDRRVEFIHHALEAMQKRLAKRHTAIEIHYGKPKDVFAHLAETYRIGKVFTNEDYDPYAITRDGAIEAFLKSKGIGFQTNKDQVIFSKQEIMKSDGTPYTVFTPYSVKWKALLDYLGSVYLEPSPVEKHFSNLYIHDPKPLPSLASMGFTESGKRFPSLSIDTERIKEYGDKRDFPGLNATSRLGIHLRFGTLSIRQLAAQALQESPVFLNELIWRDFYQMILWHFPKVGKGHAFKEAYEKIAWRNNEKEFERWCAGTTGYPMVDAGMRQLNETGFMHNRVRMVTASFLSKHLLIDWRWGEAYFAEKLLDYDLASNNGGWQWAAGSGCDAAPYFRIFNPTIQQQKFDPTGTYIKKWLPDFQELSYPTPMVEHAFARDRAIRVYKEGLAVDL